MFVFKIHSRCNLDCGYCYMYHGGDESWRERPKRVPWPVVEGVAEMVLDQHRHVGRRVFEFALHGGEPLLVGHAYMARMLAYLENAWAEDDLDIRWSVQTNGVLLDDAWLDLFERYRVRVAVSLDGPSHVNRHFRVFHDGRDSTAEAVRGIERMRARGFPYYRGVLCVLQPGVDGGELIRYFRDELQAPAIGLLLPDATHDSLPEDWSASQHALGVTLVDAYDEWRKGPEVVVDAFTTVIEGIQDTPRKRGRDGVSSVIIETDGELQPHDVLRICDGYPMSAGIKAGAGALRRFLRTDGYVRGLNLGRRFSRTCRDCEQFRGCRAGEMEHRYARTTGFMNPSVHCEAMYRLAAHVADDLARRNARSGLAAS